MDRLGGPEVVLILASRQFGFLGLVFCQGSLDGVSEAERPSPDSGADEWKRERGKCWQSQPMGELASVFRST